MSAFENRRRYLPSTLALFKLRGEVVKSAENEMELREDANHSEAECKIKFYELSCIRNNIKILLSKGKTQLSAAVPLFLNAWKIFSNFPPEHDCYLPPLYKSDTLTLILNTAVKRLLKREVGMINGSDNNVGHLVLGGVEGAGKTTLMRALALSSAALLEKLIPISHDYLIIKNPEDIVWEALRIYHSREPDCSEDPLDVLNDLGHDAFLLLDEFQHNFRFAEDPTWIAGKNAALAFHRYSRTCGTFGIIGGSSVDMHSLMFKQAGGENTDHWRKRGYPDFNGTLYELHTVPALRDITALKEYVEVRYPLWDLKDEDLSLLLTHTGGIGRWVHIVWEESLCSESSILNDDEGMRYPLCSEECLRACTAYRKLKHEKVLESAENRELIAYLLMAAQPVKDDDGNVINCGGVEKALLQQALISAGVISPSKVIEAAEANSIIYIDAGSSLVQFSRPVDAVIFSSGLPPSKHKLLLLSAIHLMVCGIYSISLGDVTDVTLEEFVREEVYISAGINEHAQFNQDVVLVIGKDQKLCKVPCGGVVAEALTVDILRELNLKHLVWKKEHGLDGICFEEDESQNNSWNLDLWQCKGGRWDVEIGGGNNSMATALINFKKKYQLKDVGDKQITEIVLKAQVGVCLIVQALRKAIPDVVIRPRRLIVTTTKQCSASCVQTLKSWQNGGGVQIEKEVLTLFGMNSRSKCDRALKSRFEVRVESGCRWVVNAVPDQTLRLMANRLLLPSNTTPTGDVVSATQRTHPGLCIIQ